MNIDELVAHGEGLFDAAAHNTHKLRHLINVSHEIRSWLLASGLRPSEGTIRPRRSNFDLVYTFPNEDLIPYARLERSFLQFANELMSFEDHDIVDFLYSDSARPLACVRVRKDSWEVVLSPHPDELMDCFPDHTFWDSVTEHEERFGNSEEHDLARRHAEQVAA